MSAVIQVHHGNNHVALVSHLQAQVKNWHVVNYVLRSTRSSKQIVQNFQNTVCNWSRNKKLQASYGLGENNS